MDRKLRTSRLFELLQEISIRHTEELGAGRKATLDKGLLWVVTMQSAEIIRLPVFDEEITVKSWPGETMHILFPRYYVITDAENKELLHASAIWMLVDKETRKAVFPEEYNISIPKGSENDGIELPKTPLQRKAEHSMEFQIPFSYVDLNGHMNNTHYFDLADDYILPHDQNAVLKSINIAYQAELCFKEKVNIQWCQKENKYYIYGNGTKNYFKMNIEYVQGGLNG